MDVTIPSAGLSRRDLLRRVGAVTGAVALGGLTTACGSGASTTAAGASEAATTGGRTDVVDEIRQRGYVIAGLFNEKPPAFLDDDRNLAGIFPAVARKVFEDELDITEIQSVVTQWDGLIPGLMAKRYDMIIAGMFITPERCQEVLFTKPFRCVPDALLLREGETFGLNKGDGYDELATKPELKLATIAGSTSELNILDAGLSEENIDYYKSVQEVIEAVRQGRADIAPVSFPSARDTLALPGVNKSGLLLWPFTPVVNGEERLGCGGFAFRKEDKRLRDVFDDHITELMDAGELFPLVEEWMSQEELADEDITVDQLCGA